MKNLRSTLSVRYTTYDYSVILFIRCARNIINEFSKSRDQIN